MRTAERISFRPEFIDQLIEGRDARTLLEHDGVLDKLRAALSERLRETRRWTTIEGGRAGAEAQPATPVDPSPPGGSEIATFKLRYPDITNRIVSLYARGHTSADIQGRVSLLLGEPVPAAAVEAILGEARLEARAWCSRPLEQSYPIVVFERVRVKRRETSCAQNRRCYFAIGYQAHGPKEVLGLWFEGDDEGAFWASVLDDLRRRGVNDVLYFLGASAHLAQAQAQAFRPSIAIAHIGDFVRQSLELGTSKDRSAIAKALRPIHGANTDHEAETSLEHFERGPLGQRYPAIGPIWRRHWNELAPFFDVPLEVRRVMTSTYAADALRRGFKRSLRGHGHSISVEDATTLMYLVAQGAQHNWKRPQREWHAAKTRLALLFPERFP